MRPSRGLLCSLSSHAAAIRPRGTTARLSSSSQPLINRILHGNQEAQEEIKAAVETREVNFSQKIARGKYVHEIVTHEVKPECLSKYLALMYVGHLNLTLRHPNDAQAYPKIASNPNHEVHHVCSMQNIVGENFKFTHIWEYKGYKGYDRTTEIARKAKEYLEFRETLNPLVNKHSNSLNQEFAFWNTIPPQTLGGIFEKRTYTIVPGGLLEWEKHWQVGLQARKQVMNPVGAWFSQMGRLNTVTHIWNFESFAARKVARDKCWEIDGWADTVHKTVPLVAKMDSEIMKACDFSPIR